MDNMTYEHQGGNTYLVYAIQPDDAIDTMSLGMLKNNPLQGFAPVTYYQADTERYLRYNVTSKNTLEDYLKGIVSRSRILTLFSSILDAFLLAEDYMIDANTIILDRKYIYIDVRTANASVVCLPVDGGNTGDKDLGKFLKDVMFSIQPDPKENGDYVARILGYLNSGRTFLLAEFKKVLEELLEPDRPKMKTTPTRGAQSTTIVAKESPTPPAVSPLPQREERKQPSGANSRPAARTENKTPEEHVCRWDAEESGNEVPGTSKDEKEISWLYLMQHYNKENAAAYKAQQARKKDKGAAKSKGKHTASARKANDLGFSVPGERDKPLYVPASAKAPKAGQEPVPQVGQPSELHRVPAGDIQPATERDNVRSMMTGAQPAAVRADQPVVLRTAVPNANFGETITLNTMMMNPDTTELTSMVQGENIQTRAYLVRRKNNERILINKPVFRIGKEKSYVDYFISDNAAISRAHANIIERGGEYYIVDTYSTNPTDVVGQMFQSNQEVSIASGAQIRFGNEEFEFKLM